MTAQVSDSLKNKCAAVDFSELHLYSVLIGDIRTAKAQVYPFLHNSDSSKRSVITACWSGYTSTYTLTASKELVLTGFRYPFNEEASPDTVYEVLEGDFWLDMREDFFGDGFYVPFKDGLLVVDESEWVSRNQRASNRQPLGILSRIKSMVGFNR